MSQTTIDTATLEKIASYMNVSSIAAKKMLDEVSQHRQSIEKAAAIRGEVLEHLLKTEILEPGQKQAAEKMLGDHEQTLRLLKTAASLWQDANKTQKSAGDLGGPVPGDAPGSTHVPGEYNSLTHPIVGERTSFVRESDIPLLVAAGLR